MPARHFTDSLLSAGPFPTSSTPFRASPAPFAGRLSPILNPPSLSRASTARASFSAVAVYRQTAGCGRKLPVPYSMSASRNLVRSESRAPPPPFASTLALGSASRASPHPWRTTAEAAFAPSARPMQARLLFENAGVASSLAARLHKRMYL